MDTAQLITTLTVITGFVGTIAKMHYDEKRRRNEAELAERRRIADREWELEDRKQAAQRTADHRDLMAVKMDANTAVSMIAAEKADIAATKADVLQASTQKIVEQTNGMQEKLQALAEADGFRKGEDAEKLKHPGGSKFPA